MKTKTIILSNPDQNSSDKGRGILSFYIEDEILICKLRLYNIARFDRYAKLAVYHQNEVYSANLLERNGCFETSLVGNFDIDKDFYTAVIDTTNNNTVIIAGGTYSGFFFENSIFEENQTDTSKDETINQEEFKDDPISNNCCDCANCKYKEYFYQSNQSQPATQQSVDEDYSETDTSNKEKIENFSAESLLENIIPQFDYIFEKYPINQEISALIENSKFVDIEENSQTFSIGAIYEKNEIKYICYAVKSHYNQPAPTELGEHFQWLPTDPEDPLSDGYYIVFQDIVDLKIVEL